MTTHDGATTVVDMLSGTDQTDFMDPVVDEEISGLEKARAEFQEAFQAGRWLESHKALLAVCRAGQRVRLEIGELALLDRTSRARTVDALQKVVDLLIGEQGSVSETGKTIPLEQKVFEKKIVGYVNNFSGDDSNWARRAALNILDRLDEAEGRRGPATRDDA